MSLSTIGVILAAVIALIIVFRILSGLLRLGIAIAIIGLAGYWAYSTFFLDHAATFFK